MECKRKKEKCERNKMHEHNTKENGMQKKIKIKKYTRDKMYEDDNKCKVKEM